MVQTYIGMKCQQVCINEKLYLATFSPNSLQITLLYLNISSNYLFHCCVVVTQLRKITVVNDIFNDANFFSIADLKIFSWYNVIQEIKEVSPKIDNNCIVKVYYIWSSYLIYYRYLCEYFLGSITVKRCNL